MYVNRDMQGCNDAWMTKDHERTQKKNRVLEMKNHFFTVISLNFLENGVSNSSKKAKRNPKKKKKQNKTETEQIIDFPNDF